MKQLLSARTGGHLSAGYDDEAGALPFRVFCERVGLSTADLDHARLSEAIVAKAAPTPQFRRFHQPTLYRIAMHVAQLFNIFALGINIAIVVPSLPQGWDWISRPESYLLASLGFFPAPS